MDGRPWTPDDLQRFRDRDRLQAKSNPSQRRMPPAIEEWLDESGDLERPNDHDGRQEPISVAVAIDILAPAQAQVRAALDDEDRMDEIIGGLEALFGRLPGFPPVREVEISIGFHDG